MSAAKRLRKKAQEAARQGNYHLAAKLYDEEADAHLKTAQRFLVLAGVAVIVALVWQVVSLIRVLA